MIRKAVKDNFPKEIKDLAKHCCAGCEDLYDAWLDGFAFCLEGYVRVDYDWTSVKEKLPKESGEYLVSCHLPLIDKKYITTSDFSTYGYKWGVEVPDGFGDPAPIVEAWKPMPKPYKEEL